MWRELDTDGSISNNSPKDSMHLIEGQDGGILCLVHVNSNVKPEVRISADGNTFESGWEKLYLTSPLQISDLANVYNYETTLYMQYYTASPSYLLHGRTVKCESWTSGFDSGNNIKVDEVAMTVECKFFQSYQCIFSKILIFQSVTVRKCVSGGLCVHLNVQDAEYIQIDESNEVSV